MNYQELRNELQVKSATFTTIQLEQEINKFIGKEIEINSVINDISNNKILLEGSSSADYYTDIDYNIDKFKTQLQTFKKYDHVKIIANLKNANINAIYFGQSSFSFDLLSIEKVEKPIVHVPIIKPQTKPNNELGCFVATACYGNFDAPEVLILRQFRDEKLLTTFLGKVFVNFYYSFSPFFVTLISKSDLLKNLVRQYFLEPIVTKLQRQNNGFYRTDWFSFREAGRCDFIRQFMINLQIWKR